MKSTSFPRVFRMLPLVLGILLAVLIAGCGPLGLSPQMTYQGVLTDQNGNPLDGNVRVTFKLYHASSGGTAFYSETDTVPVSNGRFETVVGPANAGQGAGLTPEDLAQPMWVELTVANGVYTETLSPRQKLYGAPYAFTLLPGTVISQTMDTTLYGSFGADAVVNINNHFNGDPSNEALPALRVAGERGIELANIPGSEPGRMYSNLSMAHSDLEFFSEDEIWFYLDTGNDSSSQFRVHGGTGNLLCWITEAGNFDCTGTKSAVVQVDEQPRALYAMESPGVWFEDFGSATLQDGAARVVIEPTFAKTVNLSADYHVFLTPLGECNGLYVAKKTADGFTVRELGGGSADVAFDYRIVAKRAGYETLRLEPINLDTSDGEGN